MRIALPSLAACSNCGNRVPRHRVCPKCGFYRGKPVIEPEDMA